LIYRKRLVAGAYLGGFQGGSGNPQLAIKATGH